MIIERRCTLNKCRIRCQRGRYGSGDALKKISAWRRRKSIADMVGDANRAMNGSTLVGILCILPDYANLGAIGAKDVTGSQSCGAQRGKNKAGEQNIQNERVGCNPCCPDGDASFARYVFQR